MRRLIKALGVACAFAGVAGFSPAQFRIPPQSAGSGTLPGGQAVGTTFTLNPAGNTLPAAAPQAGNPIGSPMMRPYDPSRPLDVFKGTDIDPNSVVAPVQGFPGTQNQSVFDRLQEKLASIVPFLRPSPPPRPTYTPGISRRNRERARERMWRWD